MSNSVVRLESDQPRRPDMANARAARREGQARPQAGLDRTEHPGILVSVGSTTQAASAISDAYAIHLVLPRPNGVPREWAHLGQTNEEIARLADLGELVWREGRVTPEVSLCRMLATNCAQRILQSSWLCPPYAF